MPNPLRLAKVRVSLAVIGVATVCIALALVGIMVSPMIRVTLKHRNLKVRSDTHEIGREMAAVLRDPSIVPGDVIYSKDKRMPARLRELKAERLTIGYERETAGLEFGGGFYHYGYTIVADGTSRYRMICYGENEDDFIELGTFQYKQEGEQGMDGNRPSTP